MVRGSCLYCWIFSCTQGLEALIEAGRIYDLQREMNTIEQKVQQICEQGYAFTGQFICPVSDWTVNYYEPIAENLKKLEKRYSNNAQAMEAVRNLRDGIVLYRKYPNDYSYVFYAMKKVKI